MPELPSKLRPRIGASPAGTDFSSVPVLPYAELDVTTNFSFLRGASHADELVARAAELGYRAIAITDINTLAGVVRAWEAAREAATRGLAPRVIVGTRLTFDDFPDILVYPGDRAAYGRLCRLLTLGKRRTAKGQCLLHLEDLLNSAEGLLAVIAAEPSIIKAQNSKLKNLKDAFADRLSLAATRLYGPDDDSRFAELQELSRHFGIPLLATNHVHYHDPSRRQLQDVLTCVRHGCTIQDAGFRLFPNAERYLKAPWQMYRLFADCPQAIRRGLEIAERMAFDLQQLRYEYPAEVAPTGQSAMAYLRQLAFQGAAERCGVPAVPPSCGAGRPGRHASAESGSISAGPSPQKRALSIPPHILDLLNHELKIIEQLHYEAYFLTVYDIVKFARSRGILCQGRGSAANSITCYCLGVTSVHPDQIDVLFERFISAARGEPPDIDVDFEHERREEVLQYLYERYGRERAGMTAEVITYRGRSAVRDVGKAMGLGADQVDQMARRLDWWDRGTLTDDHLREMGLDPTNPLIRKVVDLTAQLLGFPRHLSQHVGGMVMTQGPLCEMVPIENASMPNRTVIEWDKNDIDALGILKVDCLALGMLTCLSKALRLVNSSRATERRSDEATKGLEDSNGNGENISRSDCVEKGQGFDQSDIYRNEEDASGGAVRPDQSDAAGGSIHSLEYRRGTCPTEPTGLSQVPSDLSWLTGRVDDADRDRMGVGDDATRPDFIGPAERGGSNTAGIDPQLGKQSGLTASFPSSLRRSVASSLSLSTIPPNDPAVYDMICRADTIGVFQIESRAQMSMLPRLKPRSFYDLVIEVAIVRPGPIQGNMVHPYLRRRNGEEAVRYPSEALRGVLQKTLGVPLFQEQAMKIAMVGAGFSAEEADQLRRAMAAWRRHGAIERFHDRFMQGMRKNGYTPEFAAYCFEQIRGFGVYGFPESHAASFALLVYASAWIKCHYPAPFACALLNSQPMGFYAPAQIVRDAREHQVEVRPVDINYSDWDCTLEDRHEGTEAQRHEVATRQQGISAASEGPRQSNTVSDPLSASLPTTSCLRASVPGCLSNSSLRLGLRMIKGFPRRAADRLTAARGDRPFTAIADLHRRTGLKKATLTTLAEADVFLSLGLSRREALWQVMELSEVQTPLFDETQPPQEPSHLPVMPLGQHVLADYATVGLSLKSHPLALIRDQLKAQRMLTAREIMTLPPGRWVKVAGIVLIRQRPATASGIVFCTIEDETGSLNLIIRQEVYDHYRDAARFSTLLQAEGYVERQGDVLHVMAKRLFRLDPLLHSLSAPARDFH